MLLDDFAASSVLLSFGVVALAEMGDKSQLVCMTLAAKYRSRPVIIGAMMAFMLLNAIAVTLGAMLVNILPMDWITAAAALLFALFGLQALRATTEEDDEDLITDSAFTRSALLSAFTLIFAAELGDKTQLSVAAMAVAEPALSVWFGASLALLLTTALGVYAGRRFLAKIDPNWVAKGSGMLFLLLSALLIIRLI